MSSDAQGQRPRQVTIGGWVVAVASVMLVAAVFDTMTNLHSLETRDALTKAITTGSAKDLGISLTDAFAVMRTALFVAGVAAAVTAVLGVFVLQRHVAARIVLTVAAVPVVLTAPFVSGFLGVMIGGATALLWSGPARDWFAGRPPRQPQRPVAAAPRAWPEHRPDRPPPPLVPPTSGHSANPPPRPTPGWGQAPPPGWAPPQPPGPAVAPPLRTARHPVPAQVRVACILTWLFSGLTTAMYLVVGLMLVVDRGRVLRLLRDNPGIRDLSLTDDQLVAVMIGAIVVIVLWCAAAGALAFLTWRRRRWARLLLLASVGVAALVEVLALPFSVVHLVAAGTVLRLLLVEPTRRWFAGDDGPDAPSPPDQRWAPPTGEPPPPPPGGTSPRP